MNWHCENSTGLKQYRAAFLNDAGVIQAVSTRYCGNMALHTGDFPAKVVENRQRFLAGLGLELDHLIAAEQVHGTTVQIVGLGQAGSGALSLHTALPATDALITRERGVILSILTADCLPIFIYDPHTPAIAIVHAGWRGSVGKIVQLTLERMVAEFKTEPGICRVAIGPSICSNCFKVSAEVAEQFRAVNPQLVIRTDSGYRIDLSAFNAGLLQAIGVKPGQIAIADLCTGCLNEDFFSHRIEGGTMGRMMGIIALQKC